MAGDCFFRGLRWFEASEAFSNVGCLPTKNRGIFWTQDVLPKNVQFWVHMYIQCYRALSDIWCPLIPRYGSPWCPVLWGEQIMGAQVTLSNISRVVDQVQALNCAILGSNPRVGPVHYQEVHSGLHFWSFLLNFFPFDSLGGDPENPSTILRGVRISVGTNRRGTIVCSFNCVGCKSNGRKQIGSALKV